jgi:hypothetical protein
MHCTRRRPFRCEATTVEGFVQQVAVSYLARGYWFYVAGQVPEGKDPQAVDRKLIKRYGIAASQWERTRRKQAGFSNVQYIRHGNFFLLLATHGQHRFFEEEAGQIRDARRVSIKFAGYSLSFRNGRACVRIESGAYKRLKAHFLDLACRRSVEMLGAEFRRIGFVPYAPVRQQLLQVWRAVNRARKVAGYAPVPVECVPWKRPIVKPFEERNIHCGEVAWDTRQEYSRVPWLLSAENLGDGPS